MTVTLQPFGLPVGIEAAIGADSVSKGRTMSAAARTSRIRNFNDAFRTTLEGGRCLFTAGVSDLGVPFSTAALVAVRAFKDFTADNDPYGEHDFGALDIDGVEGKICWKIDYYADSSCAAGAADPAEAARTFRVLTIMLASEW